MKRVIDPVSINSVSNYTKKKLEELLNVKSILISDIESIRNYYHGTDAELIISKYLERLKIIDLIVVNYNNLTRYFSNVSMEYSNNLNEAKKTMNQVNNNINTTIEEKQEITNQTLSIDL